VVRAAGARDLTRAGSRAPTRGGQRHCQIVDRESEPGQFLLTGSTNFLTLPTLSESLAGRVRIVRLHPFSLGERVGRPDDFIDRGAYLEAACLGGFPGVTGLSSRDRDAWFDDCIDTLLRDRVNQVQGVFVAGIVLHTGTARLPFGDRVVALPIADLTG